MEMLIEPASAEQKNNMATDLLQLAIRDKVALHSHYMPFIQGGGVFVPTKKEFHLGDMTGVVIRFLDRGKKLVISGRVVWISPEGNSSGMPGVGIQFVGASQASIKGAIDSYLGELAHRPSLQQAY